MSFLDDLTPTDMALLLDFVESTSSHSSDTNEESVGVDAAEPGGPQRVRKSGDANEYRRRKRAELEQLRQEAAALGEKLSSLQRENASRVPVQSLVPVVSSVWKRMAARQLEARKHSELENARLKRALARQYKLADQLRNLLQKQINQHQTEIAARAASANSGYNPSALLNESASSIPWDGSVDAVFAEVDVLDAHDFEDVSFHAGTGDTAPYLQVRQARVFPFDAATVQQSTWQLESVVPNSKLVGEIKAWTDELIIVLYETPACIGRVEVTCVSELTVRRIQEPPQSINRFTMSYSVQSDHDAYNGLQLQSEGWYTIKSIDVGLDGTAHSIVHCLERATIHGIHRHDLKLLSEIVSGPYSAHFNHVENVLMDGLIKCRPEPSQSNS